VPCEKEPSLRVLLDRSRLEVFVAEGGSARELRFWRLPPVWRWMRRRKSVGSAAARLRYVR
jgi:hypothetical protein